MTVTAIGLIAFALGLFSLWKSEAVGLSAFVVSLIFGAAAGVIFDSLGGVNLLLGHILLGFLVVGVVASPARMRASLDTLAPGGAGFWLALIVAWGALSAVFLPRLFAGATMVYAVVRGADPTLGPVTSPLGPVSGNISQTFYLLSDLVCFVVCSAAASRPSGFFALATAMIAGAALNLAFAVLDYATFAAGAADALSFMRNATYRMLDDTQVLGYKRIVGSFSEASSFATATLAFFAFAARLALAGRWLKLTAPLAVGSVLALLASTSTTGYVGLSVCVLTVYAFTIASAIRGSCSRAGLTFLLAGSPLLCALVVAAIIEGSLWSQAARVIDQVIVAKASSDSGHERSAWNALALQSFWDTMGLGAGVGSVRASSFPIAVLASIGAPGALLFAPFLYHVLFKPNAPDAPDPITHDIVSAARFACFALLVAATLAGVFVDLGLMFFVFAALATASPAFAPLALRSRAPARGGWRGDALLI